MSIAPSTQAPGNQDRHTASPPAFTIVLAGFCAFLDLYVTQPLLPLLENIFHASKVSVSLTVTVSTLGVAVAAPFMGRIADLLGRKRVIVLSAILLAVCTVLGATASGLRQLLFWRFTQGIFTPGIFAITVAYIHEEWPEERGASVMALYVSGTVFGGFTGRMLSGLTAEHLNWRAPFLVLGLLTALAAVALSVWLPREKNFVRENGPASPFNLMFDHLRNRRLLATYAIGFCVLFSLLGAFTYVTFHLAAPPFNLSTTALGSIFFVYLVGAAVTPAAGRWIDRHGRRNGLTTAIAVAIFGLLLTLVPNLWAVITGLAICSTGVFIAQAAVNSYIGIAAEHSRALAVGLYVMFYYAGGSAGATVPGWLWNLGGWPVCVALMVAVQIATIVLALMFWPRAEASQRTALIAP